MLEKGTSNNLNGPLETFFDMLLLAWESISAEYDVQDDLPDTLSLLEDVEIHDPGMAAETIIRNMLSEVTQLVHRFSPWYTLPARSFGLASCRDFVTRKNVWRLAPEAIEKWNNQIEMITTEIEHKKGLLKAIMLINDIDTLDHCSKDTVVAICKCIPFKELLMKRTFLEDNSIVCKACNMPFVPLAG